jgi:hypothetical protein
MNDATLLNVKDAALKLNVCQQRIKALIASGRLKAHKVAEPGVLGLRWKIDTADLAAVEVRKNGRPRKEGKSNA